MKTPWKSIILSVPLWGIILAEVGSSFSLYALMTSLPVYLSVVVQYEFKTNLATTLPFTSQWIAAIICGKVTDYLITKRHVSIALMRRAMSTVGKFLKY